MTARPNGALLTDTYTSPLRAQHDAAKTRTLGARRSDVRSFVPGALLAVATAHVMERTTHA